MTRPSSLSSNDSYQLAQLAVLVISGLRSSTESWSTIDKCEKTTQHWNLLFFCNRLITITKSSCASVRLALLYLFRLRVTVPLDKAPWTWKDTRLFTVVLMLASKFLEDTTYDSKAWAEYSKIPLSDLNKVEREMMFILDYKLHVSQDYYLEWVKHCEMLMHAQSADDATNDDVSKQHRINKSESSIHASSSPSSPSTLSPLVSSMNAIRISGTKRSHHSITADDDKDALPPALKRQSVKQQQQQQPIMPRSNTTTTTTSTPITNEKTLSPANSLVKRSACDSAVALPSAKRRAQHLGPSITQSLRMLTIV
ncbi:hypothetical protein O0I10_010172 [Lichtheimia ornata]|uniref:Cyclin N-terminal domain-containing protein n=1 Tax=Lichtheimia ornata TaxID=688661 RepID=A0AAD7UWP0_9FUNG|nr:uncharacterized protein O0I10_010172 [Lichtheimia ornata]KAJ8654224.1 hypothetical protein O0I10_010172 [Lichtheimia ornata]